MVLQAIETIWRRLLTGSRNGRLFVSSASGLMARGWKRKAGAIENLELNQMDVDGMCIPRRVDDAPDFN